ncbi:hypothetical protein PGTUg99_022562 [Puccinia graminis f. sp. tritici]|uniref:Uncharacterized protein n=1 Tax=Puccinia graminis f. sp. tritici TaxID=56615 RepID=A0A5B0MYU5_PUCGR|nr:hypothetical protein PGTUg99_022562 [Puccinia graminis f. sp. tritici]
MGIDPSPHSSIRRKMKGSTIGGINGVDSHGTSSNHRQSLAFELAAAMEPEENDQASILEQLGLGGDDDDDDEEEDDDQNGDDDQGVGEDQDQIDNQANDQDDTIYEDEEYPGPDRFDSNDDQSSLQFLESQRLRLQPSRSTIGSTNKRYSNASNFGSSSSPRKSSTRDASLSTPMRTLGRELSRSTLNTIDPASASNMDILDFDQSGHPIDLQHPDHPQIEEDDEAGMFGAQRSPEDFEPSEDEDAEILEAGLKSTAQFLNLLKQSNTDCPASLLIQKAPDSQQTTQPSSRSTTPTSKRQTIEENQSDRQPVVEKMITDIVRTMTEQVRDRESQIRELKEIEIALARTDRRFLADLEELPDLFEERDFRNSTILGKSLVSSSDHPGLSIHGSPKPIEDLDPLDPLDHEHVGGGVDEEVEEDEEDLLEDGRLTPRGTREEKRISIQPDEHSSKEDRRKAKKMAEERRPMENLGELKLITNSLIHSLNQIHEHTQISRQTQIEIVRKLKGVKGLVANWKTDFDSIQNSIDFISTWESNQFSSSSSLDSLQESPLQNYRGQKIRGIFEVQVKLATSEVEKLLNEAFTNASTLLQPHPPPPSLIN